MIGVGRSSEWNQAAREAILTRNPDSRVGDRVADLSEQTQVRRLASEIGAVLEFERWSKLDILVHNAGVYLAPMGSK